MLELGSIPPDLKDSPEPLHGDLKKKLSAEELVTITEDKIAEIIKQIQLPTRVKLSGTREERKLVSINSQKVFIQEKSGFVRGYTTAESAQKIILDLLINKYGVSRDNYELIDYHPTNKLTGLVKESTDIESVRFRSSTHSGLAFTRVSVFNKGTRNIESIHWYANDIAPSLRIQGRNILGVK